MIFAVMERQKCGSVQNQKTIAVCFWPPYLPAMWSVNHFFPAEVVFRHRLA